MTSKERITAIFNRQGNGSIGFWTGNPHQDTTIKYNKIIGGEGNEAIYTHLNDDCRWFFGELGYKHPQNKPLFDITGGKVKASLGEGGVFAETTELKDIENHPWPNPEYLDFSWVLSEAEKHRDRFVFSGMWSPFYHIVADYFGMENYFVKMYTEPAIVEAVTEKVLDFYEAANEKFFSEAGQVTDSFFFGNDFGTQRDTLISPDMFRKFVLPGMNRLMKVARKYDKKILLHSCGSIYKVIPDLIDAGIDALHPLQAKAANMDADSLSEFKNDIAFVGGVDTQELLVNATPEEVKADVYRLVETLGPNIVISPSHEAILPNVSWENVLAMREAVYEINGEREK
jgi:uroporphyrinogen decarboxylase